MRLSTCLLRLFGSFVLQMSIVIVHAKNGNSLNCSKRAIGGVVEKSSRVGREQTIAMEMAIHDFCRMDNSTCSCPVLHLRDSQGNMTLSVYEVIDLMERYQVEAVIGTISPQQATLISEFHKATKTIPIISLTPTATSSLPQLEAQPSFLEMSHDVTTHMQCIAAIVGHFNWRKVTPIYENHSTLSSNISPLIHLSDALQLVDSTIERYLIFPPLHSLSNSSNFIEQKLKELMMMESRVFILLQSSIKSCILLFEKAKQLGMMGKGYVWIISDDIASLLDSVDQSVISSMQGVIGVKTNFAVTGNTFRKFKHQFRKEFRSKYTDEEEYSNPSIYALRTYDATWAVAKAIQVSKGSSSSAKFLESISHSEFNGLTGNISFKAGKLAEQPTFHIINVIGRSYREVGLWSPESGFVSGNLESRMANLGLIYWPGDTHKIPTGNILRDKHKPLTIGVPAKDAYKRFIRVSYAPNKNIAYVTAELSTEVLEAVEKKLYSLSNVSVPYRGAYGELISTVYIKNMDLAVGDIEIMADHYEYAEFLQPYMETGMRVRFLNNWPSVTPQSGHSPENGQKPLKIGVPAEAVFSPFVKVIYDPNKNKTYVTGVSMKVLEAVMNQLPYSLSYVLVPYKGTYDDLLAEVHNKILDIAVGDIEITADRYKYVEFSQPYMETEIVRVAPVKRDAKKKGFIFLYAFTTEMWIVLLGMTVGTTSVVWFNEHVDKNKDFEASSTFEYITKMLWFAVAILSLSHRELIKNSLSRLVLATWFCVNVIVAVCFSATLSSIITDSRFHSSPEFQGNNYVVGCIENSFISRYLVNVLHFSPKNIRHFNSIENYHEAFKKGEIHVAFFVSPHANVFLAKYCGGYEKIGPSVKLSGFGFAFQKGSTLTRDISEAILKVTENGEIAFIEENMLKSLSKCSQMAQESDGPRGLDLTDFTGLFIISGCVSALVFIITLSHLVAKRQDVIWSFIQSNLITRRVGKWITLLLQIRVVPRNLSIELTPNQEAA